MVYFNFKMKSISACLIFLIAVQGLQLRSSPELTNSLLQTDESEYNEQNKSQKNVPPTLTFRWNRTVPTPPAFLEEEESENEEYKNQDKKQAYLETEEGEGPGNSHELTNPLRGYEPTQLFLNTVDKLVFGDYYPELLKFRTQCIARNAAHVDTDLARAQKLNESLHDYCFKPNPEGKLFSVMHDVLEQYFRNWISCHDIWGDEKLERFFDYYFQFFNRLGDVMKKNEKDRDVERRIHITNAKTGTDRKDEVQTRVHRSIPELAADFQELNKSIKSVIDGLDSLHDGPLHHLRETMTSDDLYQKQKEIRTENLLQGIQITAEHASDFCREKMAVADFMNWSLKNWQELLHAINMVTSDDKTFP